MGGNIARLRSVAIIAVLALGLGLNGCNKQGVVEDKSSGTEGGSAVAISSGPAVPDDAQKVTVHAKEYQFDPSSLSLKAGKPAAVTLIDDGALGHDFTVYDPSGNSVSGAVVSASPGGTGTVVFTLPSGDYTFKCTLPGHEAAGMSGTITVK